MNRPMIIDLPRSQYRVLPDRQGPGRLRVLATLAGIVAISLVWGLL